MDILDSIRTGLDSGTLDALARQIGAGRPETERAVGAALPTLLGGLAHNANRSPEAARSLASALDRDHDPSLLEQLGGTGGAIGALGSLLGGASGGGGLEDLMGSLLGGGSAGKATDGAGILRHVFGDRRPAIESGVGKASGLQSDQVAKLLSLLAPLVMSALAKTKRDRGLDAGGLADALGRERRQIEQRAPGLSSGGLGSLLDRDHDGDVSDDLAGMAGSLAKAFFGR